MNRQDIEGAIDVDQFLPIDKFDNVFGIDFFAPFDEAPSVILYDGNDEEMTGRISINWIQVNDDAVKNLRYNFYDGVDVPMIIYTNKSKCQLGYYGDEIALICEKM